MITSNIRIPEELWEQLRVIATKQQRSINSQLIFIIQEFLEKQKKEDKSSLTD